MILHSCMKYLGYLILQQIVLVLYAGVCLLISKYCKHLPHVWTILVIVCALKCPQVNYLKFTKMKINIESEQTGLHDDSAAICLNTVSCLLEVYLTWEQHIHWLSWHFHTAFTFVMVSNWLHKRYCFVNNLLLCLQKIETINGNQLCL